MGVLPRNMANKIIYLTIILVMIIISGCSDNEYIDENSDVDFVISVDETLRIEMDCNPTTGYDLIITEHDQSVLELVGDGMSELKKKGIGEESDYSPSNPCVGCGGTCFFEFIGLKPGITTVEIDYCQPWNCEESLSKTYVYNVKVE